jgi:hypothetical protein
MAPCQVTDSGDGAHPTAVTNSRKGVVTIMGVEQGTIQHVYVQKRTKLVHIVYEIVRRIHDLEGFFNYIELT